MPADRARINGPEDTIPYKLYSTSIRETFQQKVQNLVKKGRREDHRSCLEHRKIFIKTGIVSQAKGSAYIEIGKTKVIVSVFDPREIPNRIDYSLKGELYCELKFAPFSCSKRRLHVQDSQEKLYSAIMKQALESTVSKHEFPNFQVDIYAIVLHDDGSCLSGAITAAGLALSEAGVPMYDLVTSVTLGIQKDTILVDPTSEEHALCETSLLKKESTNHGTVTLSLLNTNTQISQFYQTGYISLEALSEAVTILEKGCSELVSLIEKCMVQNVLKCINKSGHK